MGHTSDSYFCIQCTPYITAPETTIELPRKIFDALDMVDMWLIALIRSTTETIQLNIPRDSITPRGIPSQSRPVCLITFQFEQSIAYIH
jgi:hypothetical protein